VTPDETSSESSANKMTMVDYDLIDSSCTFYHNCTSTVNHERAFYFSERQPNPHFGEDDDFNTLDELILVLVNPDPNTD
jgi:hypothetical protein